MFCLLVVDTSRRPRFSERLLKQTLLTVVTCSQVSDRSCLSLRSWWDLPRCGEPSVSEAKFRWFSPFGFSQHPTCPGPLHVSSSTQLQSLPSWAPQELLVSGNGLTGMDSYEPGEAGIRTPSERIAGARRACGEHHRSPPLFSFSSCSLDSNLPTVWIQQFQAILQQKVTWTNRCTTPFQISCDGMASVFSTRQS